MNKFLSSDRSIWLIVLFLLCTTNFFIKSMELDSSEDKYKTKSIESDYSLNKDYTKQTNFPDYQVQIYSKSVSGNGIECADIKFSDKFTNQKFEKRLEAEQLKELSKEAQKTYPNETAEKALLKKIDDIAKKASNGDVDGLSKLFALDKRKFVEIHLEKESENLSKNNAENKKGKVEDTSLTKLGAKLEPKSHEGAQKEREEKLSKLAQIHFEKKAVQNNAKALEGHLTNLVAIRNLRFYCPEVLGRGIERASRAVIAFYKQSTIKNLFELYHTTLFNGNLDSPAKTNVEAQWQNLKLSLINQYIDTQHGKIVHYEPSENKKEILAFKMFDFFDKCLPEYRDKFLKEVEHMGEFAPVHEYIERKSGTGWQVLLKDATHYLTPSTYTDGAINGIIKTSINLSPKFPQEEHFKRLEVLDSLCREGKIEQASELANPDVMIEQELIKEHARAIQLQNAKPIINTKPNKIEQLPQLVDSNCEKIAQESKNSSFPVNAPAVSVMKAYGKDVKEITDFKATSFGQLVTHDFLVENINKQADKIFTSESITEQAIALNVVDGLLKAQELNQKGQFHLAQKYFAACKQVGHVAGHFATNFLSRLSQNAKHPIEYIKEQVTGTARLAYFIVDATLGQLLRTREEQKRYFDELKKVVTQVGQQIKGSSVKEITAFVANIMADMVFDGGLGYIAKLGSKLAKQAPLAIAKIAKAAEKINEATKPERESVVVTPEGIQIALKAEMDGAQKGSGHVAKNPDYAHSLIQKLELEDALKAEALARKIEEITNVIPVTPHGIERLIERGFEVNEIMDLVKNSTYVRMQNDGAKVFIKEISNDVYNYIVVNETSGKVITCLKKIDMKALIGLGNNYGWKL